MNGFINVNSDTLSTLKKYNYNNIYENDIKFTSIIILTYNQINYTKLCIESIRKFTPKNSYEIIVVDNGSTDNTVSWLKKQNDLKVIYNDFNNGFPAGCNQGIEISSGENILLLNNDTIVTPKWLDNLNKALYSSDEVGCVGCISNSCSNYQQINVDYKNVNKMINFAKQVNVSNKDSWDMKIKLIGYCYMVKKEIIDKVGLLDERFSPGNYEDDDFSFRILEKGYKLLLCKDVFIHHFGSASFSLNPQFAEVFFSNQAKINEKWGFDISNSSAIRLELINLINAEINAPFNILDIGCGMGGTLLQVKSQFKNSNIYGIDTNEKLVSMTKHLFNTTFISDLENNELPYETNFFDYIILGDYLEHVINPLDLVQKIKSHLKPNGYLICCVPNIMNIGVMKNLIMGRFKYEDSGLLDKNHLRFFTLAEISELFNNASFDLDIVSATSTQISPEDEKIIDILCSISNETLKNQYMAYQYILRVRNKVDVSNLNPGDMKSLKFKLLRIDNDIDIDKSLEEIIRIYLTDKDTYTPVIKQLIRHNVINKEQVVSVLRTYAKDKNLIELYNALEVI